ncbi:MAG: ATP-binding protein [Candidatus Thiodiazotropha sp.]
MARLFITLYGILFITGTLFVLGLIWLPDMALKGSIRDYYARSMFGVFGLVEDRLQSQPQSEWPQIIMELKANFKNGLSLMEYHELPLEAGDLSALKQGEFVYIDEHQQARFYKRIPDSDRYLMLALGKTREQQEVEEVEGIIQMIGELFERRRREEWPALMQRLGEGFKMPLELVPLDYPSLPADRLGDIKAGKVVVMGFNENRHIYYSRVNDSELVFRAGPYEAPFVLRHFNLVILVLFAFLVAVAVYLWVRPMWRELSRFDEGVSRLGGGDLNTRLVVNNGATLKPLAETFNGMAQRIQKLIQSHRELTGAVSHELRTPIARLRFRVDMLEDPLNEEDRKRHIIAMRKDILELEDLVSESLSYSRLDRERPDLLMDTVYLKDWLEALLIEAEDDCEGVKAELLEHSLDSQLQVSLDSKLMGRAVKNLLRNGRRHARNRLMVSADYRQGEAIIVVEDDGSGVPEEARQRIFEPFARLDTARDRESGGVGLGLAIVQQIARWHGGRAWVECGETGGARFFISWPTSHA